MKMQTVDMEVPGYMLDDDIEAFYSEINGHWLATKKGNDAIGQGDTEQAAIEDLEIKLGESE